MAAERWPRWVYDEGQEPDYRFSFANERTFLAWIRTALAMVAGGIAVDSFASSLPVALRGALALTLVLLGVASAVLGFIRWAACERAMRRRAPLAGHGCTVGLGAGALLLTVGLTVLARS